MIHFVHESGGTAVQPCYPQVTAANSLLLLLQRMVMLCCSRGQYSVYSCDKSRCEVMYSLAGWQVYKTPVAIAAYTVMTGKPSTLLALRYCLDELLLSVSYWDGMRSEERVDDAAVRLLIERAYIYVPLMLVAACTDGRKRRRT